MRKSLLAGASLVVLVAVGACSVKDTSTGGSTSQPSGSAAAAKKEISFLVFETPNLTPQFWDDNIKRVSEKLGDVTVKKIVATGDRTPFAKQLLASGQFPDIQIGLQDLPSFADGGHLYAWTDEELKDFVCAKCSAIGGKVVQLPANTQTWQVYYRKSLFEKAGIKEAPKTYADLLKDADLLKGKGVQPFVIAGGPTPWASSLTWTGELTTDLYAGNPDWMHQRREGKTTFDSPEFLKATKKFADLAAKGYLNKKEISRDYPSGEAAFLAGKGAMYMMGSWFASAGDKSDIKDDIGIFAWPGDDGSMKLPAFTGGGLSVNAQSPNVDAAKRFALAWQTDKAYLDTSAVADALFPAIKGYELPGDIGTVMKGTYELYKQARDANALVPSFGWEQGDDGMIAGMQEKWALSSQDLITGKKSAEDVAKYLDTEWDKAS